MSLFVIETQDYLHYHWYPGCLTLIKVSFINSISSLKTLKAKIGKIIADWETDYYDRKEVLISHLDTALFAFESFRGHGDP